MGLGLRGWGAVPRASQHGARVALPGATPWRKCSSLVSQLTLDPDPGRGVPTAQLTSLPLGQGNACQHVPEVAQLSPGISPGTKRLQDRQCWCHTPHQACPGDRTSHKQAGTAAQGVSGEGDGARVLQCQPLQRQAVPAACGADPARAAGLHPDAVPHPNPGHTGVRQLQVEGGRLLLEGLHICQRRPDRHLLGCKGPVSASGYLVHLRAPGSPVCACWSDPLNPALFTRLPPLPIPDPHTHLSA